MQRDGKTWGDGTSPDARARRRADDLLDLPLVVDDELLRLPPVADRQPEAPMLHNEGSNTRNWTQYNFQVLRDDVYMLGKDGSVVGGKISPVRSSSAVVVSSQDLNRQWIYSQQQTVSAEGYCRTGVQHARAAHGARDRDQDLHRLPRLGGGDNNAMMAQLLLQGTNFVNFIGRFVYVGDRRRRRRGGGGHRAGRAAGGDRQRPAQARLSGAVRRAREARPEADDRRSTTRPTTRVGVQLRGEYLYIADGEGGFRVFDIAQINQKGFSERIVTAPVSPLGQDTNVKTRYATAVAAPTTLAVDPARQRLPENEEQPIHPLYAYIYVADREEGLVMSTAATLLDGNPANNFLKRAGVVQSGRPAERRAQPRHRRQLRLRPLRPRAGRRRHLTDPLQPSIASEVAAPDINKRHGDRGPVPLRVRHRRRRPEGRRRHDPRARRSSSTGATLTIADARGLYVARTYAYVAAGKQGLAIVDVEQPEQPEDRPDVQRRRRDERRATT